MRSSRKTMGATFGLVVLVAALMPPMAAQAAEEPVDAPPAVEDVQITLRAATPADIPVTPPPGETVVLTDEDGTVTTVTAVTAACTISMSAAKPEIITGPRRVRGLTSMTVGSGCTDPKIFVGKIEYLGSLGGWFQASTNIGPNVYPGGYGSVNATYTCPGTKAQQLRAAAFNTPSGIGKPTAYSSDGAYACG